MDPIKDYLRNGVLPDNTNEAIKVKRQACSYVLDGDDLYRVRGGEVAFKCVDQSKVLKLLNELLQRICGSHHGGRMMAHRVML